MSFLAGVLTMWLMLSTVNRKPVKLWLPIGGIITLLTLVALHRWTDLPGGSGWSEGFLVGGLTGVLVLQLLARSSKKNQGRDSGREDSHQEDAAGLDR